MTALRPDETQLVGDWSVVDGKVVGNADEQRIYALVRGSLEQVAQRDGGWTTLYRDPADGRLWELFYRQSERQGGGPAQLTCLSSDEAARLYGWRQGVPGG